MCFQWKFPEHESVLGRLSQSSVCYDRAAVDLLASALKNYKKSTVHNCEVWKPNICYELPTSSSLWYYDTIRYDAIREQVKSPIADIAWHFLAIELKILKKYRGPIVLMMITSSHQLHHHHHHHRCISNEKLNGLPCILFPYGIVERGSKLWNIKCARIATISISQLIKIHWLIPEHNCVKFILFFDF